MAIKLSPILARVEGHEHSLGNPLLILCAGCKRLHNIPIECSMIVKKPYSWNGDAYFPTMHQEIFPALVVGEPACAFSIIGGRVVFSPSCQHALAGQSMSLPVIPDHLLTDTRESRLDYIEWKAAGRPLEFPA